MRKAPSDIEIGETFSQEEIETAFDTGFGYRISGINPRRDKKDNRYILVFANEDGPYSDSVTQGSFEYIGEGLSGDQDEDSPGNSALIDARSSDIPVHFFYKRSPDQDWEYQGLVDVVEYEFRESDGREVLVFTLEHKGLYDDTHVSKRDDPEAEEDDEADPPESVDDLLDTLTREQLQEFLAEECEHSPETRDRLFAHFGETAARSADEYRETVTERFDDHTEQYPVVTGPIDFSDLFDRAEQHRERGRHRAAATVYRGLFEGIDDNGLLIEGAYDHFAQALQRALDGYVDCVAALDPDPEVFESLAAPLAVRASTDEGFAGHREQFQRALTDLEKRCDTD